MRTMDYSTTDDFSVGDRKAFAALVLEHQGKLKAYISFVISDRNAVVDILQDVNLTLLDKEDEFDWGKNFFAWASGIAKVKIMSHFRDRKRERIAFDTDLIDQLVAQSETIIENEYDSCRKKMEKCLSRLSPDQNRLLRMHYGENYTVHEIAEIHQKKSKTVGQILYRIKTALIRCVEQSR